LAGVPEARVSGTVLDEQKRPIAAARVSDAGPGGGMGFGGGPISMMPRGRGAFTAPDGTFSVRVPPASDVRIWAIRTGYPAANSGTLHLAPGERKSGVVLTIPNGITVSGRVLDKDGKPVGGVEVVAAESQAVGGGVRRMVAGMMRRTGDDEVKTANDGTFSLRVKEGTYDVAFRRQGYATKVMRAMRVSGAPQPVEVTLDPAVEISGRVVRNGAGVDGVRVMAIAESAQEFAETGPDGSFVITGLSPGQLMLNAMKPDESIQVVRPVTAPAHDVTIEVPPGSRVSGRVVDKETKQPVTAFDLGLSMSRGGGGMMFSFVPNLRHFTSDDGSFVLENVPSGQTQIVVNAPGYTTARVPSVDVQEGKGVADLEIALDHGVRVVGHVMGPDGSALAGVAVRINSGGPSRVVGLGMNNNGTVSDANGDYTIDAVESGDKTLIFASSGYQTLQKTATLSGTETRVDAQLSTGTQIVGTVVTDTGVPVADAEVTASSAAQTFGFRNTRTDANGNFTLENMAPGRYTFRAMKSGYANALMNDFDIATGGPVRLTMKSGGVIFGHVSGLTADELQTATVQASGANGGQTAAVDSSGNYRIEGSPTGTVRVSARTSTGMAGGRTSTVQSVQVDPASPAQVDITFNSATVISGRVTRNGSPVDGAMVAFIPKEAQAQTTARTTTSNGGQYQVTGLDDATYNVAVVDIQRSAPFSTTYQVHGSGNFDIDIHGVSLRGRVVDTSGNPVSDVMVEIHEKADGGGMRLLNQTVQTDASGAFRLDNVQPDSYTIVASKEGYGAKSADTTVSDSSPEIQIALSQNAGVALRVVDARNGQALSARVHVTDSSGVTVYDSPFMGASDVIKLPLEPGTYRAQIWAMNYAPQTVTITSPSSPTIGITPGGTIAVQSKGGALRRARLLAADGKPYVGRAFFTVDPAPGVTILNNIAAGTYTVQILGDNNEVVATAPVTVLDGQTATVPL
ncbi:MAG TPA: carboxypeptidase regulatory-like domain-containing protein, partial [Thermoanaerobaculia bacterium]|nr:carboxypeptidase regulatory-like domain-containing protein [Thermoanaerobaculia bacterium]